MRPNTAARLLTTLAGLSLATNATAQDVRVRVDAARHEIVLAVASITIAPSTPYAHHTSESYHVIRWPVSGWMRGYEVDLLDSTGALLPRAMLHHVGMANVDRRQIAYPMAERVFAAAHETKPVQLPGRYGLPISADQRMVLYFALVNPDSVAVTGVTLRVRLRWADSSDRATAVLPFYASAKDDTRESISFDIPAGRSQTSAEFTLPSGGWLRALGGHLHDHGVELRLEDATTNKVLTRIKARRDRDGHLREMGRTVFALKRNGMRLDADRRYRVVAVYDNPTASTITGGAMGFLAGVFLPENVHAYERAAMSDPQVERDVARLIGARPAVVASSHSHH